MSRIQPSEKVNETEVEYLDLRRLSTYSSMAIPTLRDYLKEGGLPYYRLRGKILVRKSNFDTWIEQFKVDERNDLEDLVNEAIEGLKN
jgi:excisionase family DNA binding protein